MRVFLLAALAAASSATLVQIHEATHIPAGWRRTTERVQRDALFRDVLVGMKRSNVAALDKLLSEVSDPDSKEYLNYPSYEEMGNMVRPAAENTAAVREWLSRHQVQDITEHPHGDYVNFAATAEQLEAMSGGQFTTYVHETGVKVYRITSGVNVASEVASAIETFSGFNGFPLRPTLPKEAKNVEKKPTCPGCVVTPPFLRKVYNVSAVPKSGKRNIQAISQYSEYVSDSDLASFCQDYAPTSGPCKIAKYIGNNIASQPGIESMLDTEYITPLGQAETWVYSYPSGDFCSNLNKFASDVASDSIHPFTVSISYGSQKIGYCPKALMTRFAQDTAKLGAMGVTVMISSGDSGSGHISREGPNVGKLSPAYPASTPTVVAVGSTYFINGASGPEEATTQFGSGGGFSYDFPAHSYQTAQIDAYLAKVALPKTYTWAKGGRGTPDVSSLGQSFTVRANGQDQGVGGTSASSPTFAAFVTLLNEACLAESGKTLGFANPLFYKNPHMFTDVTAGTNAIGANTEGWNAIKGWDASTGLGTANVGAMLKVVRAACAKKN